MERERPEKEHASDRVAEALERDVPAEELDPADTQRVADATSSPQPDPDERREQQEREERRERD